jgi:hypothetical protein
MIRLAKKNGEYFLQERLRTVIEPPLWKFWDNKIEIKWGQWITVETANLDEEEDENTYKDLDY